MSPSFDLLLDAVRDSRRVLLTGPEGLDGDSIGACLALATCLRARVPGLHVDVAGVPGHRYDWLPGAQGMIPDGRVKSDYDGVVVLDGDRTRLHPDVAAAFGAARWTGIVDHHRSTDVAGYAVHVFDPDAESTCSIVAAMGRAWGVPVDRALAEQLYCGLIFDTGGFRHSNTDASTLRTAARLLDCGIDHNAICLRTLHERRPAGAALLGRTLAAVRQPVPAVAIGQIAAGDLRDTGASFSDVEGIIDHLLHIEGVELAALMTERAPQQVRLSLRSRRRVDCAQLARALDPQGGGHRRAAGGALAGPLELVRHIVEPALIAAVLDVQG